MLLEPGEGDIAVRVPAGELQPEAALSQLGVDFDGHPVADHHGPLERVARLDDREVQVVLGRVLPVRPTDIHHHLFAGLVTGLGDPGEVDPLGWIHVIPPADPLELVHPCGTFRIVG